jgi:hypothetical protein
MYSILRKNETDIDKERKKGILNIAAGIYVDAFFFHTSCCCRIYHLHFRFLFFHKHCWVNKNKRFFLLGPPRFLIPGIPGCVKFCFETKIV